MPLEDVDPGPDYVYPEPLDGSAQYREPLLWLDLHERQTGGTFNAIVRPGVGIRLIPGLSV